VIGTVTLMPLLVLPAMVGILVDDAGLSEPFAGWVASANFSGSASYIERFGVALGLSEVKIGFSLLIASLIGIPGAFVIVVTGHRYGLLGPLIFGMSMAVAGLVLLIAVESYGSYFFASCCLGFAWAFCLPYIQSLMAVIDRRGSAIAAGSAIATVGGAAGPGFAALFVAGGAHRRVFLVSALIFVAAASSLLLSQRRPRAQPAEVHP
jgi:predicted MFS family arabinose efflux permease